MSINDIQLEGSDAIFSECRNYRYALWRVWNPDNGLVMFIGLNPSRAGQWKNDPTITRVTDFADRWGFGGVVMMNLFAWITPYPQELKKATDPLGENDKWLQGMADKCQKVVFAWGAFEEAKDRATQVIPMFPAAEVLIINKDGTPRHPLYVPAITEPIKYKQ